MIHSPGSPAGVAKILAQSAVPVILLPAGTWNNTTGQLAVGSALPYLPTGVVNVYLFASGIAAAGLYQATFTGSAASPVAQIVGNPTTVAGAYTPALTQVNLTSNTVPGGSMGANGELRYEAVYSVANNANSKALLLSFGGAYFGSQTLTTVAASRISGAIRNRGNQAVQLYSGSSIQTGLTSTSQVAAQTTVDTALDRTFSIQAQLAVATDYIILEGYTVEVLPG